jgi:hypothetical protein
MNIHLKSEVGNYRTLTTEELDDLKASLRDSKKSWE